jgi:hypothetical protein
VAIEPTIASTLHVGCGEKGHTSSWEDSRKQIAVYKHEA